MVLSSTARTLLVVAVVASLLVGGGFAYLVWDFMRPDASTEEHYISYTLVVEPTDDLTNVSLLVPFPVGDDENVTASVLAASRETFPPDAIVDVVETGDGRMLAIEVDSLPARWETHPAPRTPGTDDGVGTPATSTATATPRPILSGYLVEVIVPVAERIDTRDPVANASTFQPRIDPRPTECFNEGSSATCTAFDTRIRLDYDAAPDATVYLTAHVEGRNEWFAGGWTGNLYSQYLSTELTGPQSGWQPITVYEETSVGSYRWPGGESLVVDAVRAGRPSAV